MPISHETDLSTRCGHVMQSVIPRMWGTITVAIAKKSLSQPSMVLRKVVRLGASSSCDDDSDEALQAPQAVQQAA